MSDTQIECPSCGATNAANQNFCSECQLNLHLRPVRKLSEQPKPKSDPTRKWIITFLAALAILWPAYSIYRFNNPRPKPTTPASPGVPSQPETLANRTPPRSAPGAKRISGANWVGCRDREYHDKLTSYSVQNDIEAFSQALAVGLMSQACVKFAPNERVFVTDTAIFSGLVRVRREGENREYWTNLEAVE